MHQFCKQSRQNLILPLCNILPHSHTICIYTLLTQVTINVLDDNDHSPVFDPEVYPIAISESTSVGSTIIRVLATDNDFGSNALLTYTITSGNNTGMYVTIMTGI